MRANYNTKPEHIPHKNRNIAYHMEWQFRHEAIVWFGNQPDHLNFYPFATELWKWLSRKPDNLGVFSPDDKQFTNRYTYDASVLTSIFTCVVNDCASFINNTELVEPDDAEIKRIRLYSESVLYTARLCEAFIKQLLFCTTFPEGDYRGTALGSLLSKDCNGCRNSKEKRHKVSLLGSLAHRYKLCHTYENCLDKHLPIVNRRRDLEAAHSGVARFAPKESSEVQTRFSKEFDEMGVEFIHMLHHISEIETRMISELDSLVSSRASRKNLIFRG